MNYIIETLNSKLRDEIIAKTDSLNYFLGGHAYANTVGSEATKAAFQESERLADERIPQLQKAIEVLSTTESKSAKYDAIEKMVADMYADDSDADLAVIGERIAAYLGFL